MSRHRREPDVTPPPVRPYRQILLLVGLAAVAVLVVTLSSPEAVKTLADWRHMLAGWISR